MLFVLNGMNICLQDRHLDIQQQPFLIATDRLIRTVIILNCYIYTPVFRRDVLWYGDVRPSIRPSGSPSVRYSFPHFSPTCFDILI